MGECDRRINRLHYRDDYQQFQEVCRQKAAYSVKKYTALSVPKYKSQDTGCDELLVVPQAVSLKGIFK